MHLLESIRCAWRDTFVGACNAGRGLEQAVFLETRYVLSPLDSPTKFLAGSPSKERLPTMYGKGPFCHTCQTNQMLLVSLLSNYLPDPSVSAHLYPMIIALNMLQDPEYERREATLPEYRESLHVRYPPVCNKCLPAVEEEILDKEKMARTNALGSWLKETKGKERTRRVSGPTKAKEKLPVKLLLWRIRGCLWAITFTVAIAGYTTRPCFLFFNVLESDTGCIGLLEYSLPLPLSYMSGSLFLPFLAVLSLFWTFWDPTYASLHRARREGRDVRLRGKQKYIVRVFLPIISLANLPIGIASDIVVIAGYQRCCNDINVVSASPRLPPYLTDAQLFTNAYLFYLMPYCRIICSSSRSLLFSSLTSATDIYIILVRPTTTTTPRNPASRLHDRLFTRGNPSLTRRISPVPTSRRRQRPLRLAHPIIQTRRL